MEVGGKYVHDIPWPVLEYEYEEDSRATVIKDQIFYLIEPLKLKKSNVKLRCCTYSVVCVSLMEAQYKKADNVILCFFTALCHKKEKLLLKLSSKLLKV